MRQSMLSDRLSSADPLRGVATDTDAEALRARVLNNALTSAPAERRLLRRRRVLPAVAASATLAVAAVAVIALMPAERSGTEHGALSPGPVAALASTLRQAEFLHVVSTSPGTVDAQGRLTPARNPERRDAWYAMDGSAARTTYLDAGGRPTAESVRLGTRVSVYNRARGLLQRWDTTDIGLSRWLVALRRGLTQPGLRVVGLTTIRGRDAYEVAFDEHSGDGVADDHRAYVAKEDGALLRLDVLRLPLPANADGDVARYERTEFTTFEAGTHDSRLLEPSAEFRRYGDDDPARPAPAAPPRR